MHIFEISSRPDLPMDTESRLERARRMGFTLRAFHGGKPGIEAFSLDHGSTDTGIWFGTAETASSYARERGGTVYPVLLKSDRLATEKDLLAIQDEAKRSWWMPLSQAIAKLMIERGFDGARWGDTVVIYNPAAIRSVHAAFDPARAGDADILA